MKKWSRIFITLVFTSVFFASCSDDDSNETAAPLGAYENGTFVLNEGNATSGSITFISDSGEKELDVFSKVNPLAPALGGYLQSLFFDDSHAYIISGRANRITVVDRYTFRYIATIDSNLEAPRYGVVLNGKAYVTNYDDYTTGSDDFLTVIDLTNYATSRVNLNNWSEKIISENGKLYIMNGYYGSGSAITPFNTQTNTSETPIELGFSPNSLQEEDDILYVLGSNKLAKINLANAALIGSALTLPTAQNDAKNLTIEDGSIYYTFENGIYKTALNANTFPVAPLFSLVAESPLATILGFAVNDNKIYISDAGDFASASNIYQYSLNGSLQNTVSVGIGPNGFYFN